MDASIEGGKDLPTPASGYDNPVREKDSENPKPRLILHPLLGQGRLDKTSCNLRAIPRYLFFLWGAPWFLGPMIFGSVSRL